MKYLILNNITIYLFILFYIILFIKCCLTSCEFKYNNVYIYTFIVIQNYNFFLSFIQVAL